MMQPYGIGTDYEIQPQIGRCCVKACPYPGSGIKIRDRWRYESYSTTLCWRHFIIGMVPFSMEYEDADALLAVPRHQTGQYGTVRENGRGWRWEQRTYANGMPKRRSATLEAKLIPWSFVPYKDPHPDWMPQHRNGWTVGSAPGQDRPGIRAARTSMVRPEEAEAWWRKQVEDANAYFRGIESRQLEAKVKLPTADEVLIEAEQPDPMTDWEWINIAAFANRRNWGDRRGGEWNDRSQGVQKNMHRWDRGGVNRKRG